MAAMILTREKVYDPVLRIIHAWNALAIVLLVLGAQLAKWLEYTPEAIFLWRFHVWAGYALVVGLVARVLWGLNGPAHARLSSLWRWRAWMAAVRARAWFTAPSDWGHHPVASLAYVLLYLMLVVMAISGLLLVAVEQGAGPLAPWFAHAVELKWLFKTPHDWLEKLILGFVVLHMAALLLHESRHGIPLAQAMVTGYQYRTVPHAAPTSGGEEQRSGSERCESSND